MLPHRITHILNFFDAFGYNSGTSKLSTTRNLQFIVYAVHIFLILSFSVYETASIPMLFKVFNYSEVLNQILQYWATLFTCWLTIFDSILHRNAHKFFWDVLEIIDQKFCCQSKFSFNCYEVKMVEFFVVTVLTTILMFLTFDYNLLSVEIAYNFLVLLCEFRVFYYLFCIEIIHFQLRIIENEVKTMQTSLNCSANLSQMPKLSQIYELHRFKWTREYFHCIYEMVNLLDEFFGWSHVAAISFCAYLVLTDLHWFYINYSYCDLNQRISK